MRFWNVSEFLPFIQKSTVHHSLVQSWFQFILKVLVRIEVRALCRRIKFFHTKLIQPWMLLCALEHAGAENGLSQTVKAGSIELSNMFEALKISFTGTKGLSTAPEKQPN